MQATHALTATANTRGITLIYISTDYVFPGVPGEAPYAASAPPRPTTLYGETKLAGEKAVLSVTAESNLGVVLRVPVLYGETTTNDESAVNVLLDAVWKAQDKHANVKMDDWAIRYPTNTEDVGRVIRDIATRYLTASPEEKKTLPKILQFSSEDRYTKYEICELLADIMGLSLDGMVPNKQGNAPDAAVQRPFDCHLDTKELKELGVAVQTVPFKDWW